MKVPHADEVYLRTSAYVNPAQRKREEAYEDDMSRCLEVCVEGIQAAIPEGRYSCYVNFSFKGHRWAGFGKDLASRLGEFGYRVTTDQDYIMGIKIYWELTFWEKIFGRKSKPQLALPLLPPEEIR